LRVSNLPDMLHCNKLEEPLNLKAYALAPDDAHAGAVLSASLPCTDGLRSEGRNGKLLRGYHTDFSTVFNGPAWGVHPMQ
jgi:hypothetical protein